MAKTNFKFIITTSNETAKLLKNAGFKQVSISEGQWLFLNEDKNIANFSELQDITYTNKLMF